MSVQIDKYVLKYDRNGNATVFNLENGNAIIKILNSDSKFVEKMGEHILYELNTGEYEENIE